MTDYPTLTLNDDRQIPQLGFGTYQIEEEEAPEAIKTALETGYWLVDTAAIYQNERGVGKGIGDWADIFLQTKIWNESQGYDRTLKAADKCLERLGRDHVEARDRERRRARGVLARDRREHGLPQLLECG